MTEENVGNIGNIIQVTDESVIKKAKGLGDKNSGKVRDLWRLLVQKFSAVLR